QPGEAVRAHRELHPRPPAETSPGRVVLVPRQRLDRDLTVDPGEPPKLLRDDRGLQRPLCGQRSVLPVAAPAAAGTGAGTGSLDPFGRYIKNLNGIGPCELGGDLRDPGPDALAGQRVPDENDRTVVRA